MKRILAMILAFSALTACSHQAKHEAMHEPSAGAKGMPGATGTFEFKPDDWLDGNLT